MRYREKRWAVVVLPLLTLLFLRKTRTLFSPSPHPGVAIRGVDTDVASAAVPGASSQEVPVSSFLQLCSELLRRDETEFYDEPFVVREQPHVCDSSDSFSSLMTMIASTWIAQTASQQNLVYDHGCFREGTIEIATIQSMLPPKLKLDSNDGPSSLGVVRAMCRQCQDFPSSNSPTVDCLGFPVAGKSLPSDSALDRAMLGKVLTSFQSNVQEAARHIEIAEASERRDQRARAEVLVYLDTESEASADQAKALPLLYYGEIIPPSVESISIVISNSCNRIALCQKHGQIMGRYMASMYPRAKLHIDAVSSTALAYARILPAPTVIFPPTTGCLLPSFFKVESHSVHMTQDITWSPWFSQLASYSRAHLSLQRALSMPVYDISMHEDDTAGLEKFLHQEPAAEGFACQTLRGRSGRWVQDMEYAREAQYASPLKRFREFPDFAPSIEQPFRSATTYRWIDAFCPVHVVSRERICNTMQSLGLTRIYIVGDSLNMQLAQALWKLLGHEDDPVIRPSKAEWRESMRFQWNRTVACPSQNFEFELVYTRNDFVDGNEQSVAFDKIGEGFNCGFAEYCLPWIPEYVKYNGGGTLLVINAGSHVHTHEHFTKSFDNFIELMDTYQKPQDVVMVRTTVPGHNGCQDPNARPYSNYHEFASDMVEDFRSWHLFAEYNDYMHRRVRERNSNHKHRFHMLDVHPMTVLRKDGHISGPQKCSTCKDDDCLHYILPGPLDWWAHLMYSNLDNLASIAARARAAISQ